MKLNNIYKRVLTIYNTNNNITTNYWIKYLITLEELWNK